MGFSPTQKRAAAFLFPAQQLNVNKQTFTRRLTKSFNTMNQKQEAQDC